MRWCPAIRRSPGRSARAPSWRTSPAAACSARRRNGTVKQSGARILTTQAGSLPRPDDLIELNRARQAGESFDERAYQERLGAAVVEVIRRQQRVGIDVPGDGEFGKAMGQRINYGAWWSYSFQRLGGLELGMELYRIPAQRSEPGRVRLTSFSDRRDRGRFAAAYADPDSGVSTNRGGPGMRLPVCRGPIVYTGQEAIRADIAHMKAAFGRGGSERGLHDFHRARERLARRQRALRHGGGPDLRVRGGDARGVSGHPRGRPRAPARRPRHRRELGHDQSRALRRGIPEALHDPGGGS